MYQVTIYKCIKEIIGKIEELFEYANITDIRYGIEWNGEILSE